jgi:hypothetical protein
LLRGRALGVLLAVDAREPPMAQLARQAAAALALANVYTDVFETTRRHKETSPRVGESAESAAAADRAGFARDPGR